MASQIVLVAHNVRSSHNIGSLLRTAEGLGVAVVYLTGYTPHPKQCADKRLPHLAEKQSKQIAKTALGAENLIHWQYEADVFKLIDELKQAGYTIVALEQTSKALPIQDFKNTPKIALIVGSEIGGLDSQTLAKSDVHVQLPMAGSKESFNVTVAAALAIYHLKLKGDGQID
jgi:23S rRNA (guanosine2251-2'-O)-methyltransferase